MYQPSLARRRALVAEHRAGRLGADDLPRDVLTSLLLGWQEEWDDQLPLREVCVYLTASIRTSTRILTNTIDELARWFERHPEDRPLIEDPDRRRDAVGEALRLHPVLPAMIRKSIARTELPSGDVIEAGQPVAFLFAQANRDRTIFGDDADEFDPHRQQRLPAGSPVYGLAFGAGQHICMGRRLAYGGTYTGDPDQDFVGTVNTLVEAFSRAGVELDAARPPVPNDDSFYDEFTSFPVRLTALHPGAAS
jgi:cytochrome P450